MKKLLLLLFLSLYLETYSQDTLYVNSKNEVVPKIEAKYFKLIEKDSLNPKWTIETKYFMDGTLSKKTTFEKYNSKKKNSLFSIVYYTNGSKKLESLQSKENKKNYILITYWKNGNKKRMDLYKGKNIGKLIKGECWDKEGNIVPWYAFGINPTFPGGQEAMRKYLVSEIKKNDIPYTAFNQKVIVRFSIEPDGSVANVEMLSGTNDPLVNYWAVQAVVDMPNFTPAMQDGNPVRVYRTLPIKMPDKNDE